MSRVRKYPRSVAFLSSERGYFRTLLMCYFLSSRWIEYAFSASLMHVMIAQIAGVLDIHLIIAIGL